MWNRSFPMLELHLLHVKAFCCTWHGKVTPLQLWLWERNVLFGRPVCCAVLSLAVLCCTVKHSTVLGAVAVTICHLKKTICSFYVYSTEAAENSRLDILFVPNCIHFVSVLAVAELLPHEQNPPAARPAVLTVFTYHRSV